MRKLQFVSFMRKELVYMRMPKAASGSVTKALKYKNAKIITHDIRDPNYLSLSEYMKIDKHQKFAFTIVRNPWDRLVSAFFFLNKKGVTPEDNDDYEKYIKKYNGDFTLFVQEAFKTDNIFNQLHIRPQYQWIIDENNELQTNFVGKFENLQLDFDYVLKKNWRCKKKLKFQKKGDHQHYKKLYTSETRSIVAKAYKEDIELFDYEF